MNKRRLRGVGQNFLNLINSKNEWWMMQKASKSQDMSRHQNYSLSSYGKCQRKIGDGTYGRVMKYTSSTSECVAVKIHTTNTSTFREIALMEECKDSKYIVDLIDTGYDARRKRFYQVMPLAQGNIYEQLSNGYFVGKHNLIRKVIFDVLQALSYLHAKNYIHRDMKPENILVYGEDYKLCDFGLSRKANLPGDSYTAYMVTLFYRPPENLCGETIYLKTVDMWSLGCIFVELITGQPVFGEEDEEKVLKKQMCTLSYKDYECPDYMRERINKISSKDFKKGMAWWENTIKPKVIECAGDAGYDLLMKMLRIDPSERISSSRALTHRYFKVYSPVRIPLLSTHHKKYQPKDWREKFEGIFEWNNRVNLFMRCYDIAREHGMTSSVIIKTYFMFNKLMNVIPFDNVSVESANMYIRIILNIVSKLDSTEVLNLRDLGPRQEKQILKKERINLLDMFHFNLVMHTGYDWFWENQSEARMLDILINNKRDIDEWNDLHEIGRALYKITMFIPEIFLKFDPRKVAESCQTYVFKENGITCKTDCCDIHKLISEHLEKNIESLSSYNLFKEEVIDAYIKLNS